MFVNVRCSPEMFAYRESNDEDDETIVPGLRSRFQ
jgi:hypothetical protein